MEQNGRSGRNALVVGAGVAGLAAASSLHAAGWTVRICERAPGRRTGGYFVRLAAAGVAAADRLGAAGTLTSRLPADGVIRGVDRHGRTVSRVDAAISAEPGGLALVRGDLERALWDVLPVGVTVRFGAGPLAITARPDGVDVVLPADAPGTGDTVERYDLVVGADGVRSTVRELVFGPHERYRHDFDHVVVSAVLPRLPGDLVDGDYVVIAEPGRTAHLMAMADHPPVIFFTYRADRPEAIAGPDPTADPVGALRAVYGDFAGLVPELLDGVAEAGTTHADTVAQIHLERWSRGRVVLVGDAAWCPSLYSGQGSALALTGGERLGSALAGGSREVEDLEAALADWESALRPGTGAATSRARRSRHFFLPGNRPVAAVRTAALRLVSCRAVAAVLRRIRPGDSSPLPGVHPTATSRPGSWRTAAAHRP